MSNARDHFSSRLGVLAATLGSAVGLGNIWKFPSLVGEQGGASFLIVYILASLCVGLPLLIVELSIGRKGRCNVLKVFSVIAPKTSWWLIGLCSLLSCILILGFYSDVAGWVFAYIPSILQHGLPHDAETANTIFQGMLAEPLTSLKWQWIVLLVIGGILIRGASQGIEKITRKLMPLLFLLLIAACIRSLTLPNAMEGLRFLFMPQWDRIDEVVILSAMGLAFFKMSLAMGCMLTYGSYIKEDVRIPLIATRVMVCDLLVSLLAGIAIFPGVFSFGFEPQQGPALLFLTIPTVFSAVPGGALFAIIFFILSAIAATGAIMSLLEVPVAWISERFQLSRGRTVLIVALGIALIGAPATLSTVTATKGSMITFFGLSVFDAYDALSSKILMPLCGIATSIFVGYFWNKESAIQALGGDHIAILVIMLCRTITPLLILFVLLNGIGVF